MPEIFTDQARQALADWRLNCFGGTDWMLSQINEPDPAILPDNRLRFFRAIETLLEQPQAAEVPAMSRSADASIQSGVPDRIVGVEGLLLNEFQGLALYATGRYRPENYEVLAERSRAISRQDFERRRPFDEIPQGDLGRDVRIDRFLEARSMTPRKLLGDALGFLDLYSDTVEQQFAAYSLAHQAALGRGAIRREDLEGWRRLADQLPQMDDIQDKNALRRVLFQSIVTRGLELGENPGQFRNREALPRLRGLNERYTAWHGGTMRDRAPLTQLRYELFPPDITAEEFKDWNERLNVISKDQEARIKEWLVFPSKSQAKKFGFGQAFDNLRDEADEATALLGAGILRRVGRKVREPEVSLGEAQDMIGKPMEAEADAYRRWVPVAAWLEGHAPFWSPDNDLLGQPTLFETVELIRNLWLTKPGQQQPGLRELLGREARKNHLDLSKLENALFMMPDLAEVAEAADERLRGMLERAGTTTHKLEVRVSAQSQEESEDTAATPRTEEAEPQERLRTIGQRLDVIAVLEQIFDAQLVCEDELKENFYSVNSSRLPYFLIVFVRDGREYALREHLQDEWATSVWGADVGDPNSFSKVYGSEQEPPQEDQASRRRRRHEGNAEPVLHVHGGYTEYHIERVVRKLRERFGLPQDIADEALAKIPEALRTIRGH